MKIKWYSVFKERFDGERWIKEDDCGIWNNKGEWAKAVIIRSNDCNGLELKIAETDLHKYIIDNEVVK